MDVDDRGQNCKARCLPTYLIPSPSRINIVARVVRHKRSPLCNVYGWIAGLAMHAMAFRKRGSPCNKPPVKTSTLLIYTRHLVAFLPSLSPKRGLCQTVRLASSLGILARKRNPRSRARVVLVEAHARIEAEKKDGGGNQMKAKEKQRPCRGFPCGPFEAVILIFKHIHLFAFDLGWPMSA